MTDIAEIVVRIKADSSQLKTEMSQLTSSVKQSSDQMVRSLDSVKEAFGALGIGVSLGAIVDFTHGALEAADNIYIMGQRIGFATDTLSKLNIPLKQNGSSIDEFGNSMKFMNRNIELAAEGNATLIKAFDDIGLSVTKLKALTPEQQFYAIANAMNNVTDQGRFTADGMAIMGRGFASIAPLIKAAGGSMSDFIDQMDGLTKEDIAKVHEADDRWVNFWEHMKIGIVESTVALSDFLNSWKKINISVAPGSDEMGFPLSERFGSTGHGNSSVNYGKQFGPAMNVANPAAGDNSDIDGSEQKSADSQKAIKDYIQNLQSEASALTKSKEALAEYKAEKGAATAAGIQLSDLTKEQKTEIDAATDSLYAQVEAQKKLQEAEQKHMEIVAHLESQISGSLADIVLNWKGAGDAISGVLTQIAKQIIEMNLTTPLVEALGGSKTGGPGILSGLFSSLPHFASGGTATGPSIVGENGPELFIPHGSGTVVPSGKFGGQSVIVQQTINLSPGLAETVYAAINQAAPKIAAAAHASTMSAIQKGGAESRIIGKRN